MAFDMNTEQLAYVLQRIGFHAVQIWPFVPSELHLLLSAVLPIYAGAHASLTRPHSAAKPPRRSKELLDDTSDDDEHESKMEALGPMDALFLPVLAGAALGGLYLLIKWLDDPTLLSKILNVYLSVFGTLALASFGADAMSLVHGFVFPDMYVSKGRPWEVKPERRLVESSQSEVDARSSPLPGPFSLLPLPDFVLQQFWSLRSLNDRKFHVRVYIYDLLSASVKLNSYAIISAAFALGVTLWTTFISAPWYLNNLSAFAFVYSALQMMSPTTSSTATLMLSGLFAYDIYFVFYTPLMVTVATSLDIPAKLLFPRPGGMSMLGLGDLVVPGMVIGFALRFDLWRYYAQMAQHDAPNEADHDKGKEEGSSGVAESDIPASPRLERPIYRPATGHWGTRFWTGSSWEGDNQALKLVQGGRFPKPYFHATLIGYVLGMLCTLLVMQVFQHAQPALLYLVPGVLGALWGTALVKGEIGMLWAYSEDSESEDQKESRAGERRGTDQPDPNNTWRSWVWSQLYLPGGAENPPQDGAQANGSAVRTQPNKTPDPRKSVPEPLWAIGYLIFFSVSLAKSTNSLSQTELVTEASQDRGSLESDE
ncbi:MAG: hypothetical protein OHK93_004450 [Ramalina farinacea]|uniref:Signal peptide peptidase n=1 Tax=Ramalina farinacea TaxID=258253 RepID=A0AA43QXC6_9LECA|nr:hypothetical protein [Ramalina farinacea]